MDTEHVRRTTHKENTEMDAEQVPYDKENHCSAYCEYGAPRVIPKCELAMPVHERDAADSKQKADTIGKTKHRSPLSRADLS